MKVKKILTSVLVASAVLAVTPTVSLALGGPSGPKLDYQIPGKLGYVMMDPYGYAPLTAVITDGGYKVKDAHVKIVPKKGGQTVEYDVNNENTKLYAGIPVFGLYPDYKNSVEVSYTRILGTKSEKFTETYTIYAPPVFQTGNGIKQGGLPYSSVTVEKVDNKFKDRLYLLNNIQGKAGGKSSKVVWNNPSGGALEWNYFSNAFIVDTHGEVRWYLNAEKLINYDDIYNTGIMMGFKQNNDGALSWGYGQRYAKYDIMGRKVFNRRIPLAYNDFSHSLDTLNNGHFLMRVGSADLKRADGKNVRTVRDVIVEVDENGKVFDDWKLFDILDPYRDVVLKALDQGAVCLNMDADHAGATLSSEELAKLDKSDNFGDIVGSGPGRNWAHVNSVDYDYNDDSIVISSRHQSAVIKIGRDKQVKWILGAAKGWKKQYQDKLLQPVDAKGNKIVCEDETSKCPGYTGDGDFDWTWTQHTAFVIDSKSNKDVVYLSVFDNGDGRGIEQPAMASMKYSRAVIYKIDQKKMTIQQLWEYGKDRGIDWYSPVTSLTEYQTDKDSVMVYSATAGMGEYDFKAGRALGAPQPEIDEFEWGKKEPSVKIKFKGTGAGYQGMPFSIQKALSK
ncbi:aryl-sulfate sulfotransferase [Halarcobacter ebronensis]|uniref:Aryl-sulfate sulfotransferase n=1 Tax=Halarcobacter ebronensis TaxID=1462615 RepID=A0A4V1M032_9BACT|nr:aryl-sulfate sulfotransferase [Halarcobacter ebronensis]QKF81212.1 arylsulfate sulfotransferase [Halarcobacter ebronensis]RXK03214.1 aryl-sulfate sulfotransferase [Halarcobacter ebronensis]